MTDVFPGAKLMQLAEWGYPMGRLRAPIDPSKAFSVIHITAIPDATAESEAAWRIRDTGLQNSATFFLNRDGSAVQCLGDPARMDPWANGDMRSPDTSNPRIADLVRSGLNANQRTLVAVENVGNEFPWKRADGTTVPGGFPITVEQEATCARIIRYYHSKAGVPINRQTVIGHYQLNSVTRANCPSANKAVIDRIVAMAAAEEDMPLVNFTPIVNRRAIIAKGAAARSQPAFDRNDYDAGLIATEPNQRTRTAVAWVDGTNLTLRDGTVYDARKRWLLTDSDSHGAIFYHERDVVDFQVIETVQTGKTQADVDAAVGAALAAFNKNLDVWTGQRPRS